MIPVQVAALRDHHVAQIHCSAFHSVVATEQGKVFAWGFGARGRLGLGALESCPVPTLVSKIAAVGLVTGACAPARQLAVLDRGGMQVFRRGQGVRTQSRAGGDWS